jgi:hypothetical protein
MSLQSIPSEREPLADGGSACDVTYALRRRGCQLAKHVAESRATKLAVAVATSDLRSAREGELMSIVVFARRGLIRRQAVAEPVCCRSPVVRL